MFFVIRDLGLWEADVRTNNQISSTLNGISDKKKMKVIVSVNVKQKNYEIRYGIKYEIWNKKYERK